MDTSCYVCMYVVYVVIVCDTFDGTNAEHSLRTIQETFSKKKPKEQP